VKAVGTNGDDGISPHIGGNGNWYIGDTDTTIKAAGTNGNDGVSPHIGGNGNWFIGATDTTIKAAGTNGNDGTSVPVNLSIFKPDANALALPVGFKWINNITVTSVQLMTNCSGISVTIGATTYNQTTLIGVTLPAGTQMVINDLTIVAGQNNANAIIIF